MPDWACTRMDGGSGSLNRMLFTAGSTSSVPRKAKVCTGFWNPSGRGGEGDVRVSVAQRPQDRLERDPSYQVDLRTFKQASVLSRTCSHPTSNIAGRCPSSATTTSGADRGRTTASAMTGMKSAMAIRRHRAGTKATASGRSSCETKTKRASVARSGTCAGIACLAVDRSGAAIVAAELPQRESSVGEEEESNVVKCAETLRRKRGDSLALSCSSLALTGRDRLDWTSRALHKRRGKEA